MTIYSVHKIVNTILLTKMHKNTKLFSAKNVLIIL